MLRTTRSALAALAAVLFAAGAADAGAAEFIAQSEGSLLRPHDLVLSPDGSRLYVADTGNNVIKVLDPHTLQVVGAVGRGELAEPHDVIFDRDGRLLVTDSGHDRIVAYRFDGSWPEDVAGWRQRLGAPEGIALDASGRIYVTNAVQHDVAIVVDGEVVKRIGGKGDGTGEFDDPHDIVIGPDGTVYVADAGNNRIQLFTPELDYIATLGGAENDFDDAEYMAIDDRGWLYIADERNHRVKIFDERFRLVTVIGTGRQGNGPGELNRPEGVEVRGDLIWISDTYNNRIVLYRL